MGPEGRVLIAGAEVVERMGSLFWRRDAELPRLTDVRPDAVRNRRTAGVIPREIEPCMPTYALHNGVSRRGELTPLRPGI